MERKGRSPSVTFEPVLSIYASVYFLEAKPVDTNAKIKVKRTEDTQKALLACSTLYKCARLLTWGMRMLGD